MRFDKARKRNHGARVDFIGFWMRAKICTDCRDTSVGNKNVRSRQVSDIGIHREYVGTSNQNARACSEGIGGQSIPFFHLPVRQRIVLFEVDYFV